MTATAVSSHPVQHAIFYETTFATPPANAAAWASGEGTTVDRFRCLTAMDTGSMRQASVQDTRLKASFQDEDNPIPGLRNVEVGGLSVVLHGAESETSDTSQVSETGFMRLLEHVTCGLSRGTSSVVDVTVNSDTDFDVTGSPGLDEGLFFWIEDANGDGTCEPVRVLTTSSSNITIDRAPNFTVAQGDKMHGAVQAYIDENALTDWTDANASTVSMLLERFGTSWTMIGGVLQLDTIELPRGDQPRLNLSSMFCQVEPPGDSGGVDPTWTGAVQGDAGLPVGVKTKVHVQDVGTTTRNVLDVISGTVNWGFPRARAETITEATDNAEGTAGYTAEKAQTTIELEVLIDTDHQDDWDTSQEKIVTIWQQAAAGDCWAIHASRAVLMEAPETGEAGQNGRMTLRFMCKPDTITGATNTDRAKSRIQIVLG